MLATIQEAGGSVRSFTWENMQRMTAAELINNLSPNLQMKFTKNPKEDVVDDIVDFTKETLNK